MSIRVLVEPGKKMGTANIRFVGGNGAKPKAAEMKGAQVFLKSAFTGWDWQPKQQAWVVPLTPKNEAAIDIMGGSFEVVKTDLVIDATAELREIRAKRRSLATTVEPPDWLKAEIRGDEPWLAPSANGDKFMPHQIVAAAAVSQRGGTLITDSTGAGKTASVARGIMKAGEDACPTLITCPAGIQGPWLGELYKWGGPDIKPVVWWGRKAFQGVGNATHVIVSYDRFAKNYGVLVKAGFNSFVLDEVHACKNPKTDRAKAVLQYVEKAKPEWRIGATATPLVNEPVDILPIIKALGILEQEWGREANFMRDHVDSAIRKRADGHRFVDNSGGRDIEKLRSRLLRAGMVHRTTRQILPWLPPARIIQDLVGSEVTGGREYKRALNRLAKRILEGSDAQGVTYLDMLREASAKDKLKVAVEWAETVEGEGGKALIFAHHHPILDGLSGKLGDRAVRIDGNVDPIHRPPIVKRFQEDEDIRFYIGGMKASGEGLTLTRADKILVLEPPWNPMSIIQMVGRAQGRLSEPKSIQVHLLLGSGTVDEDIMSIVHGKGSVIERLMGDKESAMGGIMEEGAAQRLVLAKLRRDLKEKGYG